MYAYIAGIKIAGATFALPFLISAYWTVHSVTMRSWRPQKLSLLDGVGGIKINIFWSLLPPRLLQYFEGCFIASEWQASVSCGVGKCILDSSVIDNQVRLWWLLLLPAQFTVQRGESFHCSEVKTWHNVCGLLVRDAANWFHYLFSKCISEVFRKEKEEEGLVTTSDIQTAVTEETEMLLFFSLAWRILFLPYTSINWCKKNHNYSVVNSFTLCWA